MFSYHALYISFVIRRMNTIPLRDYFLLQAFFLLCLLLAPNFSTYAYADTSFNGYRDVKIVSMTLEADRLGNVRVMLSNNRIWAAGLSVVNAVSFSDYYPFGYNVPGRTYSAGSNYRYGFQGQLLDDEWNGSGNMVSYKYRIHDARIGRFLSIDPLAAKYPQLSTYQFAANQVIHAVELEGLEQSNDLNLVNQKMLARAKERRIAATQTNKPEGVPSGSPKGEFGIDWIIPDGQTRVETERTATRLWCSSCNYGQQGKRG